MVTMALPDISIRNWRRLHPTVDRVRRGEAIAEPVMGDNLDHRRRRALQFEADALEAERLFKPALAVALRSAAARALTAHAGLERGRAFGHRLYEVRRREVSALAIRPRAAGRVAASAEMSGRFLSGVVR